MNKGDLYVTLTNQHRLILGRSTDGNIVFATRGGNTPHEYDRCQTQPDAQFLAEAVLERTVDPVELMRVEALFAAYISANNIN